MKGWAGELIREKEFPAFMRAIRTYMLVLWVKAWLLHSLVYWEGGAR